MLSFPNQKMLQLILFVNILFSYKYVYLGILSSVILLTFLQKGYVESCDWKIKASKICLKCKNKLLVKQVLPDALTVLPSTPQIRGLHTFVRNRETPRDEFIFYSKRLIRLVIEFALSLLPFETVKVETPQGVNFTNI